MSYAKEPYWSYPILDDDGNVKVSLRISRSSVSRAQKNIKEKKQRTLTEEY